MTEPETMEAGREMDAAVARALGEDVSWWSLHPLPATWGAPLEEVRADAEGAVPCLLIGGPDGVSCPRYSTTWEGMGLVVEAMDERGYWCRLVTPFDDGSLYHARFTPLGVTGWNGRPDHEAYAATAPRAVCLAALRALGEDGGLSGGET